jgi:hypothetical protein
MINKMVTGYELDFLQTLRIIAGAQIRQAKALEKIASLVHEDENGEACIKIWGRAADVTSSTAGDRV